MPGPLDNPRHEKFAQALFQGKSGREAYVLAGYKFNKGNFVRLKANEGIKARLSELQQQVAKAAVANTALTKQWVLERLMENVARSMQHEAVRNADGETIGEYAYNGSVANRALELLGKELSMFIDRKEIGDPGDFDRLTDDELMQEIRRETALLEGPVDTTKLN